MHPLITHIKFSFRHPVVRRGGIAATVASVVFIITLLFVWYPAASKHQEIKQDISLLRDQLVTLNKLNGLSRTYYATEETLERVERKLNSSISLAEFTSALNRLASKNNIKIINKVSRESQLKQNYKIQHQELTLQGGYRAIRYFMLGLRDMPTWTLITEARLKKKKGSDELIVDFVIASYQKQANT